jgi:ribosomal protein L6P/L9E
MSRIGNKPITIPENVEVKIENNTAACPISNAVPNIIAINLSFANPKNANECINDTTATTPYKIAKRLI